MSFSAPGLIRVDCRVENFNCGNDSLNKFLKLFALTNTAAGTARTYVTTLDNGLEVIGYYSLAAGSIEKANVPGRVAKGMPNYPIPVILLARLAVDLRFQGQGIGQGLLRDALLRSLAAADVIGIRCVLVHAKDPEAENFYSKFGFVPSPTNRLHLMLLLKDIKRAVQTGS